jgi:membrane-associated phospholipid phosphatase
MALSRTDLLLAGYLVGLSAVIVARGPASDGHPWLLLSHLLFGVLLAAFRRLPETARVGRALHLLYPLLLLGGFYAAIGVLNDGRGVEAILRNDAIVQRWEAALSGGQPSRDWIRDAPSVFWSGVLHLAYLAYYPLLLLPALILALRGDWAGAERVVFAMMLAFVACYAAFVLFPVAGPNYAFPHPTGPVREVWSARLVYGVLEGGSSVGAAFPSSHVAATLATMLAAWFSWPALGRTMVVPFALLVVAVVYCQMHYVVDAVSGLGVGVGAWAGGRLGGWAVGRLGGWAGGRVGG